MANLDQLEIVGPNETGFIIQRATSANGPWATLATMPSPNGPGIGATMTYNDGATARRATYFYRVIATNVVGYTKTYAAPAVGYPSSAAESEPSAVSNGVTTN